MSHEKVVGRPIGNLLYTVPSDDVTTKANGEIKVPDPDEKMAASILNGVSPKPQQQDNTKDESQSS